MFADLHLGFDRFCRILTVEFLACFSNSQKTLLPLACLYSNMGENGEKITDTPETDTNVSFLSTLVIYILIHML